MICWMTNEPLRPRQKLAIKHTTRTGRALVKDIQYRLDVNTLHRDQETKELGLNEIGRIQLRTTVPLLCDPYSKNRTTGSFILIACSSGRDAVRNADIAVTATSGNTIVFEADWLEPGVLIMSLAPGEFDEQTVLRSRVYLSAPEQVLGDDPPRKPFNTLVASGRFGPDDVVADLCDVVAGKKPGRTADDEIILYESAGLALLDVGIGHWVYQRAKSRGLGTEMPFGEH